MLRCRQIGSQRALQKLGPANRPRTWWLGRGAGAFPLRPAHRQALRKGVGQALGRAWARAPSLLALALRPRAAWPWGLQRLIVVLLLPLLFLSLLLQRHGLAQPLAQRPQHGRARRHRMHAAAQVTGLQAVCVCHSTDVRQEA